MTDDPISDVIQRYLRGEVDLEKAFEAVIALAGGRLRFTIALHDLDPAARERAEASSRALRHVGWCGRRLEGLQLMRISLGSEKTHGAVWGRARQ